jgi:hypothetical protein
MFTLNPTIQYILCDIYRLLHGIIHIIPFISPRADKLKGASLLTASVMLLHVFLSMSVSSLREFPENCVYRHSGFNCFIKYLYRKLLTTNFSLIILKLLKNPNLQMLYKMTAKILLTKTNKRCKYHKLYSKINFHENLYLNNIIINIVLE